MATYFPELYHQHRDGGGVVMSSGGSDQAGASGRVQGERFPGSGSLVYALVVLLVTANIIAVVSVLTRSMGSLSERALLAGIIGAPAIAVLVFAPWVLPALYRSRDGDRQRQERARLALGYAEGLSAATAGLAADNAMARIGAVYALGALARSSTAAWMAAAEALTQFVRVRSKDEPDRGRAGQRSPGVAVTADVQIALQVLARLQDSPVGLAPLRLDLGGLDLRGVRMAEANLRGAVLRGTRLSGADLTGADLSGADLTHSDLREALLVDAVFRRALLDGADLSGAVLTGADFTAAFMPMARLHGAVAREACFRRAVLAAADLTRADLSSADLSEAFISRACFEDAKVEGVVGEVPAEITPGL